MVITFKKNVPVDIFKVKIGDNDLECVKHMKYLGVVIDDKLKFNKNMEMLQKKIGKNISKYSKITLKWCGFFRYRLDTPIRNMLETLNFLSVR
jgi:hypothetical protein